MTGVGGELLKASRSSTFRPKSVVVCTTGSSPWASATHRGGLATPPLPPTPSAVRCQGGRGAAAAGRAPEPRGDEEPREVPAARHEALGEPRPGPIPNSDPYSDPCLPIFLSAVPFFIRPQFFLIPPKIIFNPAPNFLIPPQIILISTAPLPFAHPRPLLLRVATLSPGDCSNSAFSPNPSDSRQLRGIDLVPAICKPWPGLQRHL